MTSSTILEKDIVIGTSIRLARNVEGLVSPQAMAEALRGDGKRFVEKVYEIVSESGEFELMYMNGLSELYRSSLIARRYITKALDRNSSVGAVILNEENGISVMVNEEDHLRLQCVADGMKLKEAYDRLNEIDDLLIKNLNIAYDRRYGFITTSLADIGTGMKASVMMFLPALTMMGYIDDRLRFLESRGFEVSGMYKDASETLGFMYVIGNRFSIGKTEAEIIESVSEAVAMLAREEKNARGEMLDGNEDELRDTVMRSLGVLRYAHMMSESEFIKRFCYVKLGLVLGYITASDIEGFDKMLDECRDAPLLMMTERDMTEKEIMLFRAEYVKNRIKSVLMV